MDVASTAGKKMSTKRKAESHSRAANRQHVTTSADFEGDSGFSDTSSEHMSRKGKTDSEDSRQAGQQQASQLAVVGGSYSSLSPMIIMNNVLLKQPRDNPPALKPWGFSPTVEVVQPVVQPVVQQPQVVFLQPVVSRQASPASKETSSRHRRPNKYLPILKSYPKIAPHPGDSSSSSGRGTASSSSSSSSSTTSSSFHSWSSSGSEKSLTSNHREHRQREKQKRSLCGGARNRLSTTPSPSATPSTMSLFQSRLALPKTETSASSSPASERPSSAVSQAEFSTSLSRPISPVPQMVSQENSSSGECDHGESDHDIKRKRFSNTYNILSKSGLLDIVLRTKELHRQNRRTQSDLDRLKAQTDLFLQALCSGDTSICVKLQASLQEEGREDEMERAAQTILKAD